MFRETRRYDCSCLTSRPQPTLQWRLTAQCSPQYFPAIPGNPASAGQPEKLPSLPSLSQPQRAEALCLNRAQTCAFPVLPPGRLVLTLTFLRHPDPWLLNHSSAIQNLTKPNLGFSPHPLQGFSV